MKALYVADGGEGVQSVYFALDKEVNHRGGAGEGDKIFGIHTILSVVTVATTDNGGCIGSWVSKCHIGFHT